MSDTPKLRHRLSRRFSNVDSDVEAVGMAAGRDSPICLGARKWCRLISDPSGSKIAVQEDAS